MENDSTKALWDFYSLEDKDDFTHAYLYLKYIDHFIHHAFLASGLPSKGPPEKLKEEAMDTLLKSLVQNIAEASPDAATSIYHGKVVKLKDAIQLVTQKHDLSLITPDKVVPFKIAKDIILKNPGSIAVGDCPCRSMQDKPCLPLDVCMFIGDPFASFIADQNPKYRKISQEEAVKILEAEHKRGHVHCAYFKKQLGNRFFSICNCCSCCCTGVKMWNLLEGTVPILAPSGYVSEVSDECNACGNCIEYCRFNALTLDEGGKKAIVNLKKCMGCGSCEDACPIGAISLRLEPSKGEPLDLQALMSK